MLLVADIGNTNITVGVFKGEILAYSWRLGSDKCKTEDEYGIVLNNLIRHRDLDEKLEAAVVSSVVLPLTEKFKNAIEKYLDIPVMVLSSKVKSGITIDLEKPKEVGCDRIANACAAFKKYKTPAVVVDFGTATTFDIISNDARFLGGLIAPGIKIAAESLSKSTSLLPKLKIEASKSVIGKNTIDCMLSGIIRGHAAMIDGMIAEIEKELNSPVTTIATGGYSTVITDCMKRQFDYLDEHLTLEGLRIIYNLNRKSIILN